MREKGGGKSTKVSFGLHAASLVPYQTKECPLGLKEGREKVFGRPQKESSLEEEEEVCCSGNSLSLLLPSPPLLRIISCSLFFVAGGTAVFENIKVNTIISSLSQSVYFSSFVCITERS